MRVDETIMNDADVKKQRETFTLPNLITWLNLNYIKHTTLNFVAMAK